jgi:hypothetical protein
MIRRGASLSFQEFPEQFLSLQPRTEPCSRVDVTGRPDIYKFTAPGRGEKAGPLETHIRIVAARNSDRSKRQSCKRHRHETGRARRIRRRLHVAWRHQHCSADFSLKSRGPMSNCDAPETVRNENGVTPRGRHCLINRLNPVVANRSFPVPLIYALVLRVFSLPQTLPMFWARIPQARND